MDLSAQDTMDSWPECSEVLPASSLPVHAVHGVSQAHFRHGSRRESDGIGEGVRHGSTPVPRRIRWYPWPRIGWAQDTMDQTLHVGNDGMRDLLADTQSRSIQVANPSI